MPRVGIWSSPASIKVRDWSDGLESKQSFDRQIKKSYYYHDSHVILSLVSTQIVIIDPSENKILGKSSLPFDFKYFRVMTGPEIVEALSQTCTLKSVYEPKFQVVLDCSLSALEKSCQSILDRARELLIPDRKFTSDDCIFTLMGKDGAEYIVYVKNPLVEFLSPLKKLSFTCPALDEDIKIFKEESKEKFDEHLIKKLERFPEFRRVVKEHKANHMGFRWYQISEGGISEFKSDAEQYSNQRFYLKSTQINGLLISNPPKMKDESKLETIDSEVSLTSQYRSESNIHPPSDKVLHTEGSLSEDSRLLLED